MTENKGASPEAAQTEEACDCNGGQDTPTPSYKLRVIDEKAELDERIGKLKDFVEEAGLVYSSLGDAERDRLQIQFSAMMDYADILGARIASF